MRFKFNQIAFAGLLACLTTQAMAANFFFVQPKSPEMSKVSPLSVALNSSALPEAVVGLAYNGGAGFDLKSVLAVSGDSGFNAALASFSLTSGTLPTGLLLSPTGVLSGTPTIASVASSIQVTATYKTASGAQTYQVISLNLTVTLAAATLPAATVGTLYNSIGYDFKQHLTVSGDAAYTAGQASFKLADGSALLPLGLSISTTGVIAGTPTAATAGVNFTVQSAYKKQTGQQSYTLVVNGNGTEDPNFAQVAAMLPFDEANGSTVPVDAKGGAFSAVNGAVVSTSVLKFGTASAYFPGATSNAVVGPSISLPGDFTLESWIYPTQNTGIRTIMGQWSQADTGSGAYLLRLDNGKLAFYFGPVDLNGAGLTSPSALPLNNWSHVAVTRVGSTFRLFVNGVRVSTGTSATAGRTTSTRFTVGQYYNPAGVLGANGTLGYAGYIDDVRVSTIGRYTADFTPPTISLPLK